MVLLEILTLFNFCIGKSNDAITPARAAPAAAILSQSLSARKYNAAATTITTSIIVLIAFNALLFILILSSTGKHFFNSTNSTPPKAAAATPSFTGSCQLNIMSARAMIPTRTVNVTKTPKTRLLIFSLFMSDKVYPIITSIAPIIIMSKNALPVSILSIINKQAAIANNNTAIPANAENATAIFTAPIFFVIAATAAIAPIITASIPPIIANVVHILPRPFLSASSASSHFEIMIIDITIIRIEAPMAKNISPTALNVLSTPLFLLVVFWIMPMAAIMPTINSPIASIMVLTSFKRSGSI